jgi:hypothetical protein
MEPDSKLINAWQQKRQLAIKKTYVQQFQKNKTTIDDVRNDDSMS